MSETNDITRQVRDVQDRVVASPKQFVFSRSASIARDVSEDLGEHWGSGSYVEAGNKIFLLTNRHIAERSKEATLRQVVRNGEQMAALTEPYLAAEEVDLALMPVNPEIWAATDKRVVPLSALDAPRPAPDELLMVLGFPAAISRFSALMTAVRSKARPYIAQADTALGDDGIHFWMKHRPTELRTRRVTRRTGSIRAR